MSNFIRIDTRFKDAAGHQIGVPMGPDSKLNVRAFMIPNPNVKSLKVKVVTSAAQTLTKTLNMTNFKKSQIHFAKLPKINASNLQFDYKIWLSQLDPNIYLSEISMPGSALTFSYKLSEDYQKTQTLDLTKQFENGIRVFQFHVNTVNQTSTYDGGLNASNLTGTMNFIYSEVADPVEAEWDGNLLPLPYKYNPVYKNGVKNCATAVLDAYAKNYSSDEHKNFSMTYLGGQGIEYKNNGTKYYLPSQIAQDLNTIWLDYIRANTQNTTDELRTKPWGWIMLNRVGTEPTTSWCIEAVIRHNADPVFKHQRRSEKVRHSGDTQGTTNGGSIF